MKFNLDINGCKAKCGDIIFSEGSGYHYLITKKYRKEGRGFVLVCLDESEVVDKVFDDIPGLIEYYFSVSTIHVIPKEQIVVTNVSEQ